MELVAGDAVYGTAEAAEEAPGAAHDGFEHWLRIGGRASDHPQDFGGRRPLVERRRQLAVARLQLREQPRVLDRNDGLVGEGLQQGDLVVGERPRLRPSHRDGPDRGAVPEHRHREDGSRAGLGQSGGGMLGVIEHVRRMDDGSGEDRAPGHGALPRRERKHSVQDVGGLGRPGVMGRDVDQTTVESKDGPVGRLAEAYRVLDDRVEDRLGVGRRARDDPEDRARDGLPLQRLLRLVEQPHVLDGDDGLVGEGL